MAAGINAASAPADRVLVIERLLDAPRALVFKAWTDPEHMVHWMGPRGMTPTMCKVDARVGGEFRFGMRSPAGTDHYQKGIYRELIEPEKIVCTFTWTDAQGNPTRPETLLTLTFAEEGSKTRMTLHQAVFESVNACNMHREGWTSALEKLAEYVAKV